MPDVEEHSIVMAAQWTGAGENARVFQYNSDGKTMRFGDKFQSTYLNFLVTRHDLPYQNLHSTEERHAAAG